MNMSELKNLLIEKNISVNEFSKITKVKEKKLNRALDNQAYFSDDEANRVSAFLGVSKNELFNGVVERKGELPEVAEQNNLNHFRYYIKTRLKGAKNLFNLLAIVGGFWYAIIWVAYIASMFMGVTGLPTIIRSPAVMLLCFIIPVSGMFLLNDIAKPKFMQKRTTPYSKINFETIGVSLLLLVFAVSCFVNDFIPVEALALIIAGAIALSVLFVVSPFKNKPFNKRFLQFVVYMLPTAILIVAFVFIHSYVAEMMPQEDGALGDALAEASDLFKVIFGLLIFLVFNFSAIHYFNVFAKGVGKFFIPAKKESAISKGKLTTRIIGCVVLATITFLSILAAQGIYLKYIYTNVLEEDLEATNWTADYITDFDNQFKKGEYQVIEFEGMQVKIPKGYKLDKESEYTITYKKDDQNVIIFSKPINSGIGDSAYAESSLTPELKEKLEECYIEEYGFYPDTMYEWQKIMGMVTPDDIEIFNPKKTVAQYTVLTMKAIATSSDFSYYLYENDGMYASITAHIVENAEKGNRDIVSISFGSMDLEYTIMFTNPVQDENANVEKIEKILNSIEQN